jgi:flagellar hook-basal body complex protein FliE
MAMPITPVRVESLLPAPPRAGTPRAAGGEFAGLLQEAVRQVEDFQKNASLQIERFLAGENEDIHTTAMAVQRAELTFELFQQVRNKVVQAYQEVMRQPL